ncbi:hypothetical protein [Cellulosilyticum sp. I15G10I2]|uniref:hypothetical protein n=1 Tax=Cellulosilyticum sp. I15G10I2 TaxID=1892843 RepID=UPI001A9A66AA|nr:hypothetical protein [Cellulosilyticum sp. I15G10I2]
MDAITTADIVDVVVTVVVVVVVVIAIAIMDMVIQVMAAGIVTINPAYPYLMTLPL